jgi:hypothetical protein
MSDERRNIKRRKFNYYMRVLDNGTQQLAGYLSDISPRGFQLECPHPVIVNKDYSFRLDLTPDISNRSFITFSARCRWIKPDDVDPTLIDAGFQIISIAASDDEVYQRIVVKYASQNEWS